MVVYHAIYTYTPYYQCYRTCKYRGITCRIQRINADVLERLFTETVASLASNRELLAKATAISCPPAPDAGQFLQEEKALTARTREVQSKIENILSAVEQGLSSPSVQNRLAELENEAETIRAQLNILHRKMKESQPEPIDVDEAQELFARFAKRFPTCTEEDKETLVYLILKRATVDAEKSVEFELYVGEDTSNVAQNVKVGSGVRTRT